MSEQEQPPKNMKPLNAMKHGILAHCATPYDWRDGQEVFDELRPQFEPLSPLKRILLEQIALTVVRLSRCARFESELLKEGLNPPEYSDPLDLDLRRLVKRNSMALLGVATFEKLDLVHSRYEPRLISRLTKLLQQIKAVD